MKEKFSTSKPQEHLNLNIEGAKPIIARIGSFDDFNKEEPSPEHIKDNFGLGDMQNIDWDSYTVILDIKEFLHAGEQTYVMSTIDDSNKFSKNFVPCTGLIVAGIEKGETGKNVSFVSHQLTSAVLFLLKDSFMAHLKQRLLEMKDRCVSGTIDAVLVGGKYGDSASRQRYIDSIKILGEETKKILGFEPLVINGPKTSTSDSRGDDIYYDNENRRLYFVRPKVNPNIGSFVPSEVDKHKDKF